VGPQNYTPQRKLGLFCFKNPGAWFVPKFREQVGPLKKSRVSGCHVLKPISFMQSFEESKRKWMRVNDMIRLMLTSLIYIF
jgi:hypothetical protein